MTTNNHPAHGPVSLDRLHQIREILNKAAAQNDGGNLGYAMADAVKVIDGAIAVFGAEPVLYAAEETLAYAKMGELHLKCLSQPMGDAVIPLYVHRQATDEIGSWNNHMNTPTAQAGNSPVTPDGYALVPIVPTEDMIINGFESVPDPHFSDEKEWEEYEALSGCRQAARRAELCWAAMIKAAPKQENI
ncbi:hypothetical protein OA806_21320 [Citrobacter freundii]|nr:hypothetical protein [Citrobacter freundii]MDN4305081.1 hypothetical protein [Citrobacter freundii]